jgi:hypothetical protein
MQKLVDIFDFNEDSENKLNESIENKGNQLDRMIELNETFNKRGAFIKKDVKSNVDSEKLEEESSRFKKLSNHRNTLKEYGNDGIPFLGMKQAGQGETVNTFLPTIPDSAKNNSFSYLKPEEALEISIKRAIESGTPVNNMGFYDEVNWVLNNLGFDSRSPVEIKKILIKIISNDLNTTVD